MRQPAAIAPAVDEEPERAEEQDLGRDLGIRVAGEGNLRNDEAERECGGDGESRPPKHTPSEHEELQQRDAAEEGRKAEQSVGAADRECLSQQRGKEMREREDRRRRPPERADGRVRVE